MTEGLTGLALRETYLAAKADHTSRRVIEKDRENARRAAVLRGFRLDADHDAGRPVLGILCAHEPGGRGPLVTSWG